VPIATVSGNVGRRTAPHFYLGMSWLIAGVVVYGFSHTIGANLIHPRILPPAILYVHAAVFGAWVLLLLVQSTLVRARRVGWHRQLGLAGLMLGSTIPIVGVATGIAMARVHTAHGSTDEAQFLIVPFFDMVAFSIAFGLAMRWRKYPEFHRRLILVASCSLTVAAFNRMPLMPMNWGYSGVDGLILCGVVRDLVVSRRVHPVYTYSLPAMAIGQLATMYTFLTNQPQWMTVARWMIG
jgi:hypothetical protein